ncbi:MAG TPA: cytidine deaminase [Terriglobales bacterium]
MAAPALPPQQVQQLWEAAVAASNHAYAPFSKFYVGAAILTRSGQIFTGCNVENSSYGLTNCAERTAIFKAISEGADNGELEVVAVACLNRDGVPCAPCGACRQVIYEHGAEAIIIYRAKDGNIAQTPISGLLPEGFRLKG